MLGGRWGVRKGFSWDGCVTPLIVTSEGCQYISRFAPVLLSSVLSRQKVCFPHHAEQKSLDLYQHIPHFCFQEVEREISFRTECGLYYSYYKQMLQAPSIQEGMLTMNHPSLHHRLQFSSLFPY